uniref:acetyltransferase n=1 Tax=Ningiella ruwaisensis TaxID=2364274 RepID=UPI00109EF55D|nr:acetyltransferase [Ningiella ruwaisensis]
MRRTLCIIGAGGHGKVAAETGLESGKYDEIIFLDKRVEVDKTQANQMLEHWPIVGTPEECTKFSSQTTDYFVAIGVNDTRRKIFSLLKSYKLSIVSLIHPRAYVSKRADVGIGSLICANASLIGFSSIGQGCIINTNASVDHDCQLGDFVHVAPGANVAGGVTIGSGCLLGIGSAVLPNLTVGANTTIAAGATLIKSTASNSIMTGTPAKSLR